MRQKASSGSIMMDNSFLNIIPERFREDFKQFFNLISQSDKISTKQWEQEYSPKTNDQPTREQLKDRKIHPLIFETIPFLIRIYQVDKNFTRTLIRWLRSLSYAGFNELELNQFIELVDYIRFEIRSPPKWTPTLKHIFEILLVHPNAKLPSISSQLGVDHRAFLRNVSTIRNKFHLFRVLAPNWYKFGLSRVFLFLTRCKEKPQLTNTFEPIYRGYFEKEFLYRTDMSRQLFSIQIYTPPSSMEQTFRNLCKEKVSEDSELQWWANFENIFYSTKLSLIYNLESYNFTTNKFEIDEDYLRFALQTDLLANFPKIHYSPALEVDYNINSKQGTFDQTDLNIIDWYYELEGTDNRFTSANQVAKKIGIGTREILSRLNRMLNSEMARFYYLSLLGLSTTLTTVLITKDIGILENYMKLIYHVPFSATAWFRGSTGKEIGIYSDIFLPKKSNLYRIIRDGFFDEEDIEGFCNHSLWKISPRRVLSDYWDNSKKRWKWKGLDE